MNTTEDITANAPTLVERAQALATINRNPQPTPLDRMVEMLNKGVKPEQLEQLLAIQEKWQAGEARRAYTAAMADFKREPLGKIVKRKAVRYETKDRDGKVNGAVNYKHETLDAVVDVVRKPLGKHGLSFSWDVKQVGNAQAQMITVRCTMTHILGHSDHVELFGSPDDSGRKNPIQQVRSTVTFLQRTTLLLLCGLAAQGEDDDGGKPSSDDSRPEPKPRQGSTNKATAKQVKLIETKLDRAGIPVQTFLDAHSLGSLADVTFDGVNTSLWWIAEQAKVKP